MKFSVEFRGEDLGPYACELVDVDRCVLCDSTATADWASAPSPFRAVQCENCGFVWMRNQPTPETLGKYYADYIGRRRTSNPLKMKQRLLQYQDDKQFLERFVKSGKLLDVGCNGGFFLEALSDQFEKHGIEIDEAAVQHARQNAEFGSNIRCGDILKSDFARGEFDVLVMRGTIEHVPRPVEVIARCGELLRPGGFFYITATPNIDSLAARLFRDRWTLFHPVQHLWHFSPGTLRLICERFDMVFVSAEFPYLGTAYENHRSDLARMLDEIAAQEANVSSSEVSPPYFESMMSVIFRKL